MAPSDPSSGDNRDDASQRVSDDVSRLLRTAAYEDSPRMPKDVADRIRAQMASEFGTTFSERVTREADSAQAPIIVPLPVRRPNQQSAAPATSSDSPREPKTDGATVHSFEAGRTRREGRRRNIWAASAAAAAVVVAGGIGSTVLNNSSTPAAKHGPVSSQGGQNAGAGINVSDVRITQTNTKYTNGNLFAEAKKNDAATAPLSSSVSREPLTTKQGVNSCLSTFKGVVSNPPQSAHADFGTYMGQPAVIITLTYPTKKEIVVVQRTCTQTSHSVLYGPATLT